jgi:23S rRNA pseudouridine2605 synthase
MSLNRVAVGPVTLKGLPIGECRPLTRHEVDLLRKVASGIAVSVPDFAHGEPSTRSRRDGRRGDRPRPHSHHAEPSRSRRREKDGHTRAEDGAARPPRRPAGARNQSSHAASRPAPPQNRSPAASGTRGPRGHAVDGGTPHETAAGPAARSKRAPMAANRAPDKPKRPPGDAQPKAARPVPTPPEETPPRRRIIGLKEPAPATGTRRTLSGRPGRKRPTARKPRPPRGMLAPRPGRPAPEPMPNDEEP